MKKRLTTKSSELMTSEQVIALVSSGKKYEWPPNSPDLIPLEYRVWGTMLVYYQKYTPKLTNIAELKNCLAVNME